MNCFKMKRPILTVEMIELGWFCCQMFVVECRCWLSLIDMAYESGQQDSGSVIAVILHYFSGNRAGDYFEK